jgi:hypothetical protein
VKFFSQKTDNILHFPIFIYFYTQGHFKMQAATLNIHAKPWPPKPPEGVATDSVLPRKQTTTKNKQGSSSASASGSNFGGPTVVTKTSKIPGSGTALAKGSATTSEKTNYAPGLVVTSIAPPTPQAESLPQKGQGAAVSEALPMPIPGIQRAISDGQTMTDPSQGVLTPKDKKIVYKLQDKTPTTQHLSASSSQIFGTYGNLANGHS